MVIALVDAFVVGIFIVLVVFFFKFLARVIVFVNTGL